MKTIYKSFFYDSHPFSELLKPKQDNTITIYRVKDEIVIDGQIPLAVEEIQTKIISRRSKKK